MSGRHSGPWLVFLRYSDIAVKPSQTSYTSSFRFVVGAFSAVTVHFVLAGVEIINQLVNQTAGHTAELYVFFLIMPAAMPAFRNVIVNRNGCPPHLVGQRIFFRGGSCFDEDVSLSGFSQRFAVKLEVVKSKTSLFHCARPVSRQRSWCKPRHSPLTHHSPLTTPWTSFPRPIAQTICLALIPSAWAANVVMRRCVKTARPPLRRLPNGL